VHQNVERGSTALVMLTQFDPEGPKSNMVTWGSGMMSRTIASCISVSGDSDVSDSCVSSQSRMSSRLYANVKYLVSEKK